MFSLGMRSRMRLKGVHPDLQLVVREAIFITECDYTVLWGVRTMAQEREFFRSGKSQTMHSRHLTGHAVDLGAWVAGRVSWNWELYEVIAKAMKTAAAVRKVPLEWGGDWKTLKDGGHFQLPWKDYPAP